MNMCDQPESITLRDGTAICLRPIRLDDAARLRALHSRLSPESIRLRFLAMHPALSFAESERLATVDYANSMAFVATLHPAGGGGEDIIGVARYAALGPEKAGQAEAAVVVQDRYQGLGVGTILVDRLLAYARTHGIRAFVAEISFENDRMIRFIRRSGFPTETRLEDGVCYVQVNIAPKNDQSQRGEA